MVAGAARVPGFSERDRDDLKDWLLARAQQDPDVVGGALLGSLAHGQGDRWSDLDLMFAAADEASVGELLERWSDAIVEEFAAAQLFDLVSGSITYRVFVLPSSLELDLSFTAAYSFGPGGPRFRLLFGEAVEQPWAESTPAGELFGYAVHHALHARACLERGRYWQAEYWISAIRDHAMHLACVRRRLDGSYGRDFDALPEEVVEPLRHALVRSLDPEELRRALGSAVTGLLRESDQAPDVAGAVEPMLLELVRG